MLDGKPARRMKGGGAGALPAVSEGFGSRFGSSLACPEVECRASKGSTNSVNMVLLSMLLL